jgi:serine/threonine protein kinase
MGDDAPDAAQDAAREEARALGESMQFGTHTRKSAQEVVAAEWKVGDVILDLYEVKQIHEGGGMGLVYRVHHRGWNMDLAVKSPRAEYFHTEAQRENFIKECETWINLGLHPHIVSCHYVRTLGGIPRVFAEYVEGGSLENWITSRKLYERGPHEALKQILDIAIQFAWGLHYAHEKGLVHQDVKPANALVTLDGTVNVSDFGLAQARAAIGKAGQSSGPGHSMLVPGAGFMTKEYASPEQAAGKPLNRKTDIWSWAVCLYEMFVGERTWALGVAAPESLEDYLNTRVEEESLPQMPGGVAVLLKQCFQPGPNDRPKNMEEVAGKLKELYQQAMGLPYPRLAPLPRGLDSGSRNNRGLSLFDLGRQKEAERVWEEALDYDPHHSESTFHLGLVRWRSGRISSEALLRNLRTVCAASNWNWLPTLLMARVQLEMRDPDGAVDTIMHVHVHGSERSELRATLSLARRMQVALGQDTRLLLAPMMPSRPWSTTWNRLSSWALPEAPKTTPNILLVAGSLHPAGCMPAILLGAKYSCISVLRSAETVVIRNEEGEEYSPSAVGIDGKGRVLVGRTALNQLESGYGYSQTGFVRQIGTDYLYGFPHAKVVATAADLATQLIKRLLHNFSLHFDFWPKGAVFAIPTESQPRFIAGMRAAAAQAGIESVFFLEEPLAVMLAYGFHAKETDKAWLVLNLDLDGLGASLVRVEKRRMLVPNGGHTSNVLLGGQSLLHELTDFVLGPTGRSKWDYYRKLDGHYNPLRAQYALEEFSPATEPVGWLRLAGAVERAADALGRMNEWELVVPSLCKDERGKEVEVDVRLCRSLFQNLARPYLEAVSNSCLDLLKQNGLGANDIEGLILAGPASRGPFVRQALCETVHAKLECSVDPVSAAAMGAAIFAGTLNGYQNVDKSAGNNQVLLTN